MPKRPSTSNVRLDAEQVDHLRMAKGLSVNALADKAIVASRTVQRGLSGQRVSVKTVEKLAKVLGVEDCNRLIERSTGSREFFGWQDAESKSHLAAKNAEIRLPIPRSLVKAPAEYARLLQLIAEIIQLTGTVIVLKDEDGSIKLTLQFSKRADIEKLVVAFCNFRLAQLAIDQLEVSSAIDCVALLPRITGHLDHTDGTEIIGPQNRRIEIVRGRDILIGLGYWSFALKMDLDEHEQEHFFRTRWAAVVASPTIVPTDAQK